MMKINKVKENYIFRRAYNKGKCFVTPFAVVYILKNRGFGTRLGITAGKKIGKAVMRNRAKRVISASFRECAPFLSGSFDYIIVARPRILTVKSTVVTAALIKAFKEAGVYSLALKDKENA